MRIAWNKGNRAYGGNCLVCGEYWTGSDHSGTRKYCSRKCYFNSDSYKEMIKRNGYKVSKMGLRRKSFVMNNGYKSILKPDHPFARDGRYIYEHRLVMEDKLGRYLDPKQEVVHHINEVRTDNRSENLVVLLRKDHQHYHKNRLEKAIKEVQTGNYKLYLE